jgi:LIM domain-binding protein 2
MDDTPGSWQKNAPVDSQSNNHPNNFSTSSNSFSGPIFPSGNQGSPANNNTPQYTSSPAPSGSSTPGLPGPLPPQNSGNNSGFQPNSNAPGSQYNGPGSVPPFGSPSAGGQQQFGRPGSSGPSFGGGHFPSPGGPGSFAGAQFGLPPGSPFHGVNHGGHVGMMGPQSGDRLDQG